MSSTEPQPVTREVLAEALGGIGLVPFLGGEDQIAAILPAGRVLRLIVQPGRPVQGVAESPRLLAPEHEEAAADFARTFNATTYLPKVTVVPNPQGQISVRMQHTFLWPAGATAEQVAGEVQQFVMATLGAMARLDQTFPDQWSTAGADKEPKNV